MRNIISFNRKWAFRKGVQSPPVSIPEDWELVNLPHTYNGIDGQDGGNDYYRGKAAYLKAFNRRELPEAERYYIEVKGANSVCEVYLNGRLLTTHKGGYSTFRCELTSALKEENLLALVTDNSHNEEVYPQMADFTFYGGVYRDVNIIAVDKAHFELNYYGSKGIMATPRLTEDGWIIEVQAFTANAPEGYKIKLVLCDAEGNAVCESIAKGDKHTLKVQNPVLWQGRENPYLYTLSAELVTDEKAVDEVSVRLGLRTFEIDSENGFILNGKEYPLRGVSRHQDRWELGNALKKEHHEEDMALIKELGATTVRLAHYQHDEYFYDLCDENGIVVWAEIPYISKHEPKANANAISQMRELIVENYHHPSIVVWGLSNEITMQGDNDPDLLNTHKRLNELCHELDETRKTAVAAVSPCDINSPYLKIPDVVSYNHYFGWYGGETDMNGPWFDNFHSVHPEIPIGCSEYGCEALDWHTSEPVQGDYTEEYQAHYHEQLILQLFKRKYLWATHVWNMFDFGADARNEGGENGQNHKGLVTFDRKYKKDAFYAYKAWLSDEPFVHIAGKRYVDRVESVTRVTVYSNLMEVELFVNGKSVGKKREKEHFFYFDVPNEGVSVLKAVAGAYVDSAVIRKVDTFNEAYRLKESHAILNWFDITMPEGRLSINDKLSEIMRHEEGRQLIDGLLGGAAGNMAGFEINDAMRDMLGGFTLLRLSGLLGTMGKELTKEQLTDLNKKLNQIKK